MDHGASRHYIPLVFFFFPLPLLAHLHTQCKARAENTAGRKNATASVLIPASTAQCTRQKHPLNIGVYGPRRGKSTRVKPPWSFGHLSAFAMLFLPVFLSISLSLSLSLLPRLSPLSHRMLAFALPLSQSAANAYSPSSKPTSRFSRFFADCLPYPHSHPLRADFPAFSPAHSRVRPASTSSRWKHRAIKGAAGKSVVRGNGAAILMRVPGPAIPRPRFLPAMLVEVRCIRAGRVPRSLLNLLTYIALRALRPLCPSLPRCPASPSPLARNSSHDF